MLNSLIPGSVIYTLVAIATLASTQHTQVLAADADTIKYTSDEKNKCLQESKRQNSEELSRVYDQAFKYYVEICAASTWQMRGASDGGNYGHAFGAIKGACIVKDASGRPVVPPKLAFCQDGFVGISSDYIFGNVQWLPVEGRNFFLYGEHPAGVPLDQAAADRIKAEANSRGIFNGVLFAPGYEEEITREGAKKGLSPQQFRPTWQGTASLGTDFALAAARGGVHCTRIPMWGTKSGSKPLKDMIAHLNSKNDIAFQKGFHYDGAVNNCTSNFSNALAALPAWSGWTNWGGWPTRNTEGHPSSPTDLLTRKNDLSVPYNDMFAAYKAGSEFDLAGVISEMRSNQELFNYFKETGWLPAQVGVLVEAIPAMSYMNSVYNTAEIRSFASFPLELQKKFILGLRQYIQSLPTDSLLGKALAFTGDLAATVAEKTVVGRFLNSNLKSWMGIDIAQAIRMANDKRQDFDKRIETALKNLKPVPPPQENEFNSIIRDENHRGTNLTVNLKWWRELYTRYLLDLNQGKFGNDEVVSELRNYFSKQVNDVNIRLSHESQLTPKPAPACEN